MDIADTALLSINFEINLLDNINGKGENIMNTLMSIFKWVCYSLVLIGALNWGLIGAFNFDLVGFLFGDMTAMARIIYTLVGLSAVGYFAFSIREEGECSHYNC